jgi:RHS repeat-associated protein
VHYELTNHLGNVLAVLTDRKLPASQVAGAASFYRADAVNVTDYYAFGQAITERTYNAAAYKYGYNGKEKDNDMYGEGNAYDFGARINDVRLGRWLSLDPLAKKYPSWSPYNSMGDNPIVYVDEDGRDIILKNTKGEVVATITKSGAVIAKGQENSRIVTSYLEAKAYFENNTTDKTFSYLEQNSRSLIIQEIAPDVIPSNGGVYEQPGFDFMDANGNKTYDKGETSLWSTANNDAGVIKWNPNMAKYDAQGNKHSPASILLHEAKHAKHAIQNLIKYLIGSRTEVLKWDKAEEKPTIEETNKTQGELLNGDGKGGSGPRADHGLTSVLLNQPTTMPDPKGKPIYNVTSTATSSKSSTTAVKSGAVKTP